MADLGSGEGTLGQVFSLVGELLSDSTERVALVTERLRKMGHSTPACQAGCSYCCYLEVLAVAPEVLQVAAYLREHFSPEELAAVRQRLAERCAEFEERSSPHLRLETPCALLVEGSCSVYPVRPIRCAAWNSLDATRCRQWHAWSGRTSPVTLSSFIPQNEIMAGTGLGLQEGLAAAGYPAELLQFSRALAIALDNPDAGGRWLAGEPVFAPAYVRP